MLRGSEDIKNFCTVIVGIACGVVYIIGKIDKFFFPFTLITPDGKYVSISQYDIDREQNPIQCHAAELVATSKCGSGLFKYASSERTFNISDDVFKEASNCFFLKMHTNTNNLELSKICKDHLDKRLNEYKDKYPKERMMQLANLVRHTRIEFKDKNLQFNKPGGGYVSIDCKDLFFGNKIKISFYARHTYTKKHLEQAINNLFREYDAQLGSFPELAPNITLKGKIR